MTPEIRIVLADDHDVVRRGLTALLDGTEGFTVVGAAADGEEAVALAGEHAPDVGLVPDPVQLAGRSRRRRPEFALSC